MATQHLQPPTPPVSWTDVHESGQTLEGTVTGREEHMSKATDQPFEILELVTDDSRAFEVICGRADLRKFIERYQPMPGDRIALSFWGTQGTKNVYTGAIEKAGDNRVTPEPASDWLTDQRPTPGDEHVIAYQDPQE